MFLHPTSATFRVSEGGVLSDQFLEGMIPAILIPAVDKAVLLMNFLLSIIDSLQNDKILKADYFLFQSGTLNIL